MYYCLTTSKYAYIVKAGLKQVHSNFARRIYRKGFRSHSGVLLTLAKRLVEETINKECL